ncbi:transcriptional regulator YfaX, HTH-type [Klebsiella pneumoniae]|uniref:Transcriptional regulator YfaX, HTH-type n=1 Tax=Klebsiella pneumoniae TaxID=573 RepID=A0A378FXD8_KLEPN|nr:transcriptional regulator YfaX, HTH-type [Klebsiella pneumoniae]
MRCVAAPVFNANNDLTAAISVVGTRLQINETIAITWLVRRLPARKIFHVCWGGKSPFEQLASS